MTKIIIDEQFKAFLPALDAKTFSDLERDIINHGVRDAIVLWDGILIDGYNRHAICVKHDLPFRTVSMEFSSRDEVLIWIINNQIIRRNLTSLQLSYFRGVHYRAEKKIITNVDGKNQYKEVEYQNDTQPQTRSTAAKLGEKYNVSPITIKRNSRLSESIDAIGEISPEAKRKVLAGEIRIDKNVLERLSAAPDNEVTEIAERIEDGTYKRRNAGEGSSGVGSAMGSTIPDTSKMSPFEAAITKISGELFIELQKQAKDGDTGELKLALRSYIVMLEDLYKSI